ncbi:MAG: DUF4202 domain-containing protein [Acidimicrobiia bacterium]|nr:DUF4202 domain-containing protein [Acidimicrobiia bacterium]
MAGRPDDEVVDDGRYRAAIAAVDRANADDPNRLVFEGTEYPKEVLHARLMTEWVQRLDPDATVEQLLAARAHHLRRWELPRGDYPEGRAGYLRWRAECKRRHADQMAAILADVGYDADVAERVGQIVRKENLRSDPAVQTHEDALCLVFLQTQFGETAAKLGDDKTVDVLRKTWHKMSPQGHELARGLDYDEVEADLLERALAG